MTPLFKKLNLKDRRAIVVLNAPASFEPELRALDGVAIHRKVDPAARLGFGLAFAITQAQLDQASSALMAAAADGDATLWIAYPKATSKRYACEFSRDSGWQMLGDAGFEPVRQVSIDEDWSALRFRQVAFIESLTRSPRRAISQAGKTRLAERGR
ncbi:hypothetical protein LDO32_10710 [Luteimonas sp. Y-2-2-4F]|nr:hypothetical protein [Luteimonas sp. Y-2-2-4F]MCD9032193.1 hypothetical protein [Luteimonas sp. Y-2-2-4F]